MVGCFGAQTGFEQMPADLEGVHSTPYLIEVASCDDALLVKYTHCLADSDRG